MRLQSGEVAAALLEEADLELKSACNEKTSRGEILSEGKVINTHPGKLKWKEVFHICFESNNHEALASIIASCIDKATQLQ